MPEKLFSVASAGKREPFRVKKTSLRERERERARARTRAPARARARERERERERENARESRCVSLRVKKTFLYVCGVCYVCVYVCERSCLMRVIVREEHRPVFTNQKKTDKIKLISVVVCVCGVLCVCE